MSSLTPSPSSQSQHSKPQRVLACVRCQQRKVKCNRRFPCQHCTASRVQCVPATLTPRGQRRRRFPERELLDRLRKYEDLLRQNNIKFEPLHTDPARQRGAEFPHKHRNDESDEDPSEVGASPATTVGSERVYEAKNLWHALSQGSNDSDNDSNSQYDDLREVVANKGWVQLFGDNDHLLFGFANSNIDLSTLHPKPVQMFRLWQVYLDNVNPLLKVTHTPSLQGLIIEAASDVSNINPALEALMFSIYCMAMLSLEVDDCQAIFGSSKEDLTTRFQFGCQQALINCGFLRSADRNCLTALYLYLISVRRYTVPQSLSAMLGIAIRVAQRMGIHSESALSKHTPLEAELRRRLWWSLVLFDTRMSEMADHKTATLAPTWDCKIPLNVNDSDLSPEMKEPPTVQGNSTDALFVVVRSELADFVRNASFYLDFTNPALKSIAKPDQHEYVASEAVALDNLEKTIDDKYLKFCDPENQLHFMTIWWTRTYLAKCRFLEHHSRHTNSSLPLTEAQRDVAIALACRMLECDTRLRSSPLSKRFQWMVYLYFPFPAYIQILQDLRRRPGSKEAERAWEVMSNNYDTTFVFINRDSDSPFFKAFTKMLLDAWEAREVAFSQGGDSKLLIPPSIVSAVRHRVAQVAQNARIAAAQQLGVGINDVSMPSAPIPMPMSMGSMHNMSGQGGYGMELHPDVLGQIDVNLFDLSAVDWGFHGVDPGSWDPGL